MALDQLQPQVWAKAAGPGHARFATRKSHAKQQLETRGYLLALAYGEKPATSHRLVEDLFAAYYQDDDVSPLALLQRAFEQARGDNRTTRRPSLLAVVVHGDRLYLGQAGQGRTYLWREQTLHPLSGDATGSRPDFYRPLIVRPGDRVLLCSHDLFRLFQDEQVLARLIANSREELLQAVFQRTPAGELALITANLEMAPSPAVHLVGWQKAVWLTLLLVALVQLAALLSLRGLP